MIPATPTHSKTTGAAGLMPTASMPRQSLRQAIGSRRSFSTVPTASSAAAGIVSGAADRLPRRTASLAGIDSDVRAARLCQRTSAR